MYICGESLIFIVMAINYQFALRPDMSKGAQPGDRKYYAYTKSASRINTRELAKRISMTCSLSAADVSAGLVNLSQIIQQGLIQGMRVELKNFGSFYVEGSSAAVLDPAELTASHFGRLKVKFTEHKYLSAALAAPEFHKIEFTS